MFDPHTEPFTAILLLFYYINSPVASCLVVLLQLQLYRLSGATCICMICIDHCSASIGQLAIPGSNWPKCLWHCHYLSLMVTITWFTHQWHHTALKQTQTSQHRIWKAHQESSHKWTKLEASKAILETKNKLKLRVSYTGQRCRGIVIIYNTCINTSIHRLFTSCSMC